MTSYQLLLFDADRTLFDFDRAEESALRSLFQTLGVPPTDALCETYRSINDNLWWQLERGELDQKRLQSLRFERLLEHMGQKGNPEELNGQYLDFLSEQTCLLDGALESCRALSKTTRMAIITNGLHRAQQRRFENSALRPYFSDIFISEDLGCQKPEKKYFDLVLESLCWEDRNSVLVVGDSLSSDIQGAANAGINACWFNPGHIVRPQGLPIAYEITHLRELLPLLGAPTEK